MALWGVACLSVIAAPWLAVFLTRAAIIPQRWRRPQAPPPKPSILGDGKVLAEAYAERSDPYAISPLLRVVVSSRSNPEAIRRRDLHRCGLQCVAHGCVYGKLAPPRVVTPQRLGGWTAQVAKAGWPAHDWVSIAALTYRCARCLSHVISGPRTAEAWAGGDVGNCHIPLVPGEWEIGGRVVAVRLVDLNDKTFQDSQGLVYPLGEGRIPG
jgi:hypothetical protein